MCEWTKTTWTWCQTLQNLDWIHKKNHQSELCPLLRSLVWTASLPRPEAKSTRTNQKFSAYPSTGAHHHAMPRAFLTVRDKKNSTCFGEAYALNTMRLNPLTHVVPLPTTSPFPTHLSWSALQHVVIKQAATLLHHDKAQGNSLQRSMHKYHEYPCIERYWIWTFSILFEGHLRLAPVEIRLESVASFKSWRRRSTSLCQSMRQNQKAAERSVRVN